MNSSSFSIRRFVKDLPIPKKLALIIGLFSVVIFSLLLLSYLGMEILSGSRAYVHGESFWSKAQKGAIYRLTRYALFHDEADYREYLEHIAVVQGDHQARLEMAKPDMNWETAAQGFVQGRNHPADVKILILMARKLHNFPYMHEALVIWGQADSYVERLDSVAHALHQEIAPGHPSPARIRHLLDQIQAIDAELTPLEDNFSYTLGEGARWLKRILLIVMVLATGVLLAMTLTIAFFISRHLCGEINQLRAGAARVAAGEYSFPLEVESRDEIGDLARSFHEMAAQRQQAERLKDEFFANVSHELRTPLTLVLSPLESLLASDLGPFGPEAKNALQIMHNNAVRLLQLVNGLLDFSKLEAGQLKVNREAIRIAQLTEMIYKDFQPMMQHKKLRTQLEVTPPDALIMIDRYLYERIFFNLLSNAVKFTAPGGHIDIHLRVSDDQLTLSVSDAGIGIPSHELQNIFQRFRQVEGSSTRRFEGTGLGLALVKEFVDLLQGKISVESVEGEGSTFTVTCSAPRVDSPKAPIDLMPAPGVRAQRYAPASSAAANDTSLSLPKVLIAEDNVEMASYIAGLLTPIAQTQIARDGRDALDQIGRWSPDLVITDVMMPERDGLSLCRDMKANPATALIPVVMLTAVTHREALLEGWKAGADEYLFKPFHPKELVTRIQSILKNRLAQKRAEEKISDLNENLSRHAQELEIANRELESFSYSVSHDLRTPLRAIDGFSKELLSNCEPRLNDRDKDDLHRIRAATDRMSHLIDALLELSHVSRNEPAKEIVDLNVIAGRIIDEFRSADPARVVDFRIAPSLTAYGDPRQLSIVLENLIGNALKFTQKRSTSIIEVGTTPSRGTNAFFVRDNGAGFNMVHAAKLFGAFQRLHDASEFPGLGIGLATVQRILHRHGGRIWAEAEENRGAIFYFVLPSPRDEVLKGGERLEPLQHTSART